MFAPRKNTFFFKKKKILRKLNKVNFFPKPKEERLKLTFFKILFNFKKKEGGDSLSYWDYSQREIKALFKILSREDQTEKIGEFLKRVAREILFTDPPKYEDKYWRLRKIEALKVLLSELNKKEIEEAVKAILRAPRRPNSISVLVQASYLLCQLPLPEGLKKEILELNHSFFLGTKRAKEVIDQILPIWFVASDPFLSHQERFWRDENQVPIFHISSVLWENLTRLWYLWDLRDQNSKGALISLFYFKLRKPWKREKIMESSLEEFQKQGLLSAQQILETVVLLKDVSYPQKGYAIRVPPETQTVHQAIAWMYQQDPKRFKGFDIEV